MKGYDKYLPKEEETKLVQAQINADVHDKAKAIIEEKGWTWRELMNGLLAKFVDESKAKKNG